jgi:hypothetical protein
MKKQFILALFLLTIVCSASAQKVYKLAKSSGRLNLNITGAVIEGYTGNEIIFTAAAGEEDEIDDRAKGLRAISGSGFTDNTGLGIEVIENGQDINVNSVTKKIEGLLTIKVPQGIKVVFNNTSNIYQSDITLKNLKNEIEVSVSFNKISLENNTGPMNIKSLHGPVDAVFTGEIKGPISIVSVYGYVDVTMPTATKANIELASTRGNLYAADAFKIAIDKPIEKVATTQSDKNVAALQSIMITGRPATVTGTASATVTATAISGLEAKRGQNVSPLSTRVNGVVINTVGAGRDAESIKGKINGGGADLVFKSNFQNVYLRTK